MFIKKLLLSFVIFCSVNSFAAYDPSSQNWGIASLTGSTGGCTINRWKSGLGIAWLSCSRTGIGSYTLTFVGGFFAVAPICTMTAVGSPLVFQFNADATTSGVSVTEYTILNILSDGTFYIWCR